MQKSRLWCIKTSRQKKKGIIFKFYAPFTDCISNINNAKIDNAGDMDVVMPMYNLITGKTKFAIADTNSYGPVITLSTEYNIKLMTQLESSFKRIINWKKDQSKLTDQEQNICFDYLSDRSFQGVDILLFYCLKIGLIQ